MMRKRERESGPGRRNGVVVMEGGSLCFNFRGRWVMMMMEEGRRCELGNYFSCFCFPLYFMFIKFGEAIKRCTSKAVTLSIAAVTDACIFAILSRGFSFW